MTSASLLTTPAGPESNASRTTSAPPSEEEEANIEQGICKARTPCVVGESFETSRGGRDTDRTCAPVASCSDGIARPATLTTDNVCAAAASQAAMAGGIGGASALLILLLIVVAMLVVSRRRRAGRDKAKSMVEADARKAVSFINPMYETNSNGEMVLEDSGGALGRRGIISNPLYEENEQEVEGLYDEVVGGHAFDDDELVADYDEVGPADEYAEGDAAYLDVNDDAAYMDVNGDAGDDIMGFGTEPSWSSLGAYIGDQEEEEHGGYLDVAAEDDE